MIDLTYISEGNEKTECFSFDLPAKITCPGMTDTCDKVCYAYNFMFMYKAVNAKYKRNLKFANSDGFVTHMIAEIPANCEFRIHVSGDFYSYDYVRKWEEIVAERPDVTFYTYTRSWLIPEIWGAIEFLHEWGNVNVNLSVDKDTGKPNSYLDNYRWCYLTGTDSAPDWMREGDIIFRSNHTGQKRKRKNDIKKGIDPNVRAPLIHKLGGVIVCPFERGRDMPKSLSCAKCHLCVDKPKAMINA